MALPLLLASEAGKRSRKAKHVLVVRHLLDYVSRHGYALFGWWRLIVGGLGLMALLIWN